MRDGQVTCNGCHRPLSLERPRSQQTCVCPGCAAELEVTLFPALFRESARGRDGTPLVMDDEASCFYHADKQATVTCERCGRFLCALCDLALAGEHVCPTCLSAGKRKGTLTTVQTQRILYDNLALAVALYPLLIFWLTPLTAPAALFLAIRHWRKPGSLVRGTRWRLVLAAVAAILQIGGWTVLVYAVVNT